MSAYSLSNPVFVSYLIAASIMILKLMGQGWITVFRMIRSDAGLLNPEDLLPGPANPNPRPEQLASNDYVERSRRIHRNDLENIPTFLACTLCRHWAIAHHSEYPVIAFIAARLAHTLAYTTGQRHEVRATLFSIGSIIVIVIVIVIVMAVQVLLAAVMAF
jgi:glutathione S-transferase